MLRKFNLIFSIVFLLDAYTTVNADTYFNFGYDFYSVQKEAANGYTTVRVTFKAPEDAQIMWEVNSIPVIERDRFSITNTSRNNGIYISTLTTTADFTLALLSVYSFRPYFVISRAIIVRSGPTFFQFNQTNCSFMKPKHTGVSVNLNYKCNTVADLRSDATLYYVKYNSTETKKTRLMGDKRGGLFESESKRTTDGIESTVTPYNTSLLNSASILGTYGLRLSYKTPKKRYIFTSFEIEDDVDFTGVGSPLYNQSPMITKFYHTPYPFVGTRSGVIVCEAIGNPIPSLEIRKDNGNGEKVIAQYPSREFRTKFMITKTLVVNYPSTEDSGNYTCIARSNSLSAEKSKTVWFEPPPTFETNVTREIEEDGTEVITLKVNGYYDYYVECYKDNIYGRKLNDKELFSMNFYKKEKYLSSQNTIMKISIPPSLPKPDKIICRAYSSWFGDSYYTVDV